MICHLMNKLIYVYILKEIYNKKYDNFHAFFVYFLTYNDFILIKKEKKEIRYENVPKRNV